MANAEGRILIVQRNLMSRHTAHAILLDAGSNTKFRDFDRFASFMSHSATSTYVAVMKTLTSKFLLSVVGALALGLAVAGPAQAQSCLDNRQIQEAVSSGQIMSLADVLASAGIDGSAEILSVQVCDEGSGLVYIIGVLTPDGEAQNLVVSAQ